MATEILKFKDPLGETSQAQTIARRYRCEFVDLKTAKIDHELFRTVPVDLMFRYHFVPLQSHNGCLEIAQDWDLVHLGQKLLRITAVILQVRPVYRDLDWSGSPEIHCLAHDEG